MGEPAPLRRPLHAHLHRLHGVRLKLNRAQAHAGALQADVDSWSKGHPYGVFGEYEPGVPEKYVFKVRFLNPIPPDWAITLGDFVHNARSALDHLAYVIVMANNGGMHERTFFPVTTSPFDWPSQAKGGIRNASQRHIDLIESFQPYHRRDLYGWNTIWSTIEDPLFILNRLSNIDKHIVLNATPAAIQSIGFDVEPVWDVERVIHTEVNHGVLVDGENLITAFIESNGPNPELKLERRETVEIRVQYRIELHDSWTLRSINLKEGIDAILARLWEIFEVFVGEFR